MTGRDPQLSLIPHWKSGEVTLGAWCMMPGALGVEAVTQFPYDWVVIDMQHGCISFDAAVEMIRAADISGIPSLVRVPWNNPSIIGQVLDAGALGIIVPMIESVEDAKAAIKASYYPPQGQRSLGPIRVGTRDGLSYFPTANERIALIPMIETRGALEAVEEIAALEEVDAVFVGPYDLSLALGLAPGDNDGEAAFDFAIDRVMAACEKAGKCAAVLSNETVAPRRVEQGFQMVSVSTDIAALSMASQMSLEKVRGSSEMQAIRDRK